jgi:PLP dependent protein
MTDDELRTVLADRIAEVRTRIAAACAKSGHATSDVTLVAVTKTVSPRVAGLLPELGVADLGESRPQELRRKAEALKELPIRWHLVGHLQRNKVERTLPLVHLIHSIDSLRLLQAVAAEGAKRELTPQVLLQVNASHETQKHGFDFDELRSIGSDFAKRGVVVRGLMGMAALSDDPEQVRPTFAELRRFRDQLEGNWAAYGIQLAHLSMGMSGDFEVGIEEGATLVRIGTSLFHRLESE